LLIATDEPIEPIRLRI